LARELPSLLPLQGAGGRRLHIKLEQAMAGRERHLVDIRDIPGRNDEAARIGIGFYHVHQLADLVHMPAIRFWPRTPLVTVHRTKVAFSISPLVPYPHPIVL